MKEYENRNVEVESNSDFEAIDMSIAAEDMGFVFDIMFSQMYRDPIGSIIREITSNCFDSHIEAKINDAVIISLNEDDGGSYIAFKDVGIGISPDRMKKIYSKPAKSTKRGSNDFIGYWGLGSKSPLAYVEEGFEVITISEGKQYNYIVHKDKAAPKITLLTTDDTTEHNGTIVKIYFKRDQDKTEFDKKLEGQLRYFDNVFVINSKHFNNSYKLFEGKHFKFRNDCALGTNLHLAIGKVTYPIDWEKLGIKPISLPFALKFNIGDLPVTPERESIKYTSIKKDDDVYVDTRDIIKEKIKWFQDEIQDLVGTETVYHNNFFDYIAAQELKASIVLLGVKIVVPVSIAKFPPQLYEPLSNGDIEFNDDTFFSEYCVKRVYPIYNSKPRIYQEDNVVRLDYHKMRDSLIVREFTSINKIKQIKLDYLRDIAKDQKKSSIVFIYPKPRKIYKQLKFKKSFELDYSKWNRLKLYKYFKSVVAKEIFLNSVDYYTLEIPKEFEADWKLRNKLNTKTFDIEDDGSEIVVEDICVAVKSDRKKVLKVPELAEFDGFVLYGFTDDLELLENFVTIFSSGEFKDFHQVIKIRQKDEKHIFLFKNVIKAKAFMSDNPIFKKVATATYINKSKINDYQFHKLEGVSKEGALNRSTVYNLLFFPLADKWKELNEKAKSTINFSAQQNLTNVENFLNEIHELAVTNNWLEEDTIKAVEKVEKYFAGLELFNYIVPDKKSLSLIAKFVKLSGKPINKEWEGLEPWQIELMKELQAKFVYVKNVVELTPTLGYSLGRNTTRFCEARNKINQKVVKESSENILEFEIFNQSIQ